MKLERRLSCVPVVAFRGATGFRPSGRGGRGGWYRTLIRLQNGYSLVKPSYNNSERNF